MKSKLIPLLAVGLALAGTALAQTPAAPKLVLPQASPPATLKQQVGITDIEVTYNRPGVKGRKIFGGLVPYGEIWRTGANSATKITFSTDVKIGGAAVPAGTYELFSIPGEQEWTVIIHKNMSQWGSYAYDPKNDVARVTARVSKLPSLVETFWIGINDVRDTSATLNLNWEYTRVSVPLTVDTVGMLAPKIEAAIKEQAKPNAMLLFSSAMFYYENDHDLPKALEWINAAIAARPDQMWMIYRKGLILEKMGDKAAARAAAEESLALAEKEKPGELREEYVRLNQALLARVK
ncbi:DUF2911 domain-containing protein [Oleiharenicola sp. Vm1]|uniref:DUF2911 domain-containing protein n=1 Tax=Oleiharenicola sp. Vm1 TaxID=3398393 RepID=UPI0039F458FF